jgi:hypothetical protein
MLQATTDPQKVTQLRNIFAYDGTTLNLTGFHGENIPVFDQFRKLITHSPVFKQFKHTYGRTYKIRQIQLDPSLNSENIAERQDLLKRLMSVEVPLKTKFFKEVDLLKLKYISRKNDNFYTTCSQIFNTLTTMNDVIDEIGFIAEAAGVKQGIQKFKLELEEKLFVLEKIKECDRFYVDGQAGNILYASQLPENTTTRSFISGTTADQYGEEFEDGPWHSFEDIYKDVKKAIIPKFLDHAVELMNAKNIDFERDIYRFVRHELRFNKRKNNLRMHYEWIALATNLLDQYKPFLEEAIETDTRWRDAHAKQEANIDSAIEHEGYVRIDNRAVPLEQLLSCETAVSPPMFPTFGSKKFLYNIQNLFPPKLMGQEVLPIDYTPINFQANIGENKHFFAGLHSGGKSFFLENMVLNHVIGQLGLPLLAEKMSMPIAERLFYHRSVESANAGRFETEVRRLGSIVKDTKKGDVIILDEFLDSTNAEIGVWVGSKLLDDLLASDATVFVSSHVTTDYEELQDQGWVIWSPEHGIDEEGKIYPTHRLLRGLPLKEINEEYAMQVYRSYSQT